MIWPGVAGVPSPQSIEAEKSPCWESLLSSTISATWPANCCVALAWMSSAFPATGASAIVAVPPTGDEHAAPLQMVTV